MKKPEYYEDTVKEFGEGYVIVEMKFTFDKKFTTPPGDHKKLQSNDSCAYPERQICNYGSFFKRCEHMKYAQFGWACQFRKSVK